VSGRGGREERKMRRRITVMAVMLFCVCGLLFGGGGAVVSASPAQEGVDPFLGEVVLLRQDGENYVMQVTVENRGGDFSGTVQVIFVGNSLENCAYNTELDLPAQGKKQFTINVTGRAVDDVRGLCAVNFLDERGRLLQTIPLKNVFGSTVSGIPVGILSDDYSGLTYLDAGGRDFNMRQINLPLQLVELNQENLRGYLDGLYFLVIDRFNVSSLDAESIEAVQNWVKGGGWLLVGTGAYADQTLSGFDEDFLGVEVEGVSEPGEENAVYADVGKNGYYYSNYLNADIDFSQMAVAELDFDRRSNLYESTEHPALTGSVEDGAVSVFLFSLGEKELQKLDEYAVQSLYEEAMYRSLSFNSMSGSSDIDYTGSRLLAFIDSINSNVDFTWLEVLMGVYVVLAGPVLYLVLRRFKKSEWYWAGVPVLGLVFICGVFFLGRGARVVETRVYSLTAQQTESNRADTYFLAYHSGVEEWDMRLADSYDVAGPGWSNYGWYNSGNTASDYYYVVNSDSQGLSIGIKPQANFDSGFLYAGRKAESKGTFSGSGIKLSGISGNVEGTVTNGTVCDLAYMAVWSGEDLMVFSDVKAGETLDLHQALQDGRCVYQNSSTYYDRLIYDLVGIYGRNVDYPYARDDIAALSAGLGIAYQAMSGDSVIIAGVVKDYDKAVVDNSKEVSYGCLYSYVEGEVEDRASN